MEQPILIFYSDDEEVLTIEQFKIENSVSNKVNVYNLDGMLWFSADGGKTSISVTPKNLYAALQDYKTKKS